MAQFVPLLHRVLRVLVFPIYKSQRSRAHKFSSFCSCTCFDWSSHPDGTMSYSDSEELVMAKESFAVAYITGESDD